MASPTPPAGTSECSAELSAFYRACCCGNEQAHGFLLAWHDYCHHIDDLIDEGWTPLRMLSVFVEAKDLYSLPFYRRHAAELSSIVDVVTADYILSVAWEQAGTPEQRQMADHLRFAGNKMIAAVAKLCGGTSAMTTATPWLLALSWRSHHDAEGKPV